MGSPCEEVEEWWSFYGAAAASSAVVVVVACLSVSAVEVLAVSAAVVVLDLSW